MIEKVNDKFHVLTGKTFADFQITEVVANSKVLRMSK